MRQQRGFTLIELMVVVVIMGALMAIAIPAYQKSVQKSKRSTAEQMMLQIASLEQQYFLDARSYTDQLGGTGGLNVPNNGDPWTCPTTSKDCTSTYYTVHVDIVSATTFSIKATAQGTQASDGNLYYNADSSYVFTLGSKVRTADDGKW